MTTAALMLLIGLAAGWIGALFWEDCLELWDIWKEER
jgi:hypothetical protein